MSEKRPTWEILQSGLSHNEDENDRAVLDHLRESGSYLTKATDVVFYLYIAASKDARTAASILEQNGFVAEVQAPLGKLPDGSYESRYSIVAHIDEVPSLENIRTARILYEGLAKRYNGEYDGWEAAVTQ